MMRLALAQESPSPLRLHIQVRISVGFSLTTSRQGRLPCGSSGIGCLSGGFELCAVYPHPMHDDGQFPGKAILARFAPRRAATRIAHALSEVQLVVLTSITCAAS